MADKRVTDLPELIQADSGDYIPIVDSSMNVTKKVAAEKVLPNASVEMNRLNGGSVAGFLVTDASGMVSSVAPSLQIKSAKTTSTVVPGNGSNTNLGTAGAAVNFTLQGTGVALVTVDIAMGSTSDWEFRPQIFKNGTVFSTASYVSQLTNGPRHVVRTYTWAVDLNDGLNTLSAGVNVSSAAGHGINAGGASIAVLALGKVVG